MPERPPTDDDIRREIQAAWDELAGRKPRFRSLADRLKNDDDFFHNFAEEEYPWLF